MAKLENYDGSIDLISGLRQKNNGEFPLMDANAIQTREDGTRLDEELEEIKSSIADIPSVEQTYNATSENPQSGKAVAQAVADLVNSAPGTLDTLNELAAALGDDPNFATTVTTALGNKVDKDGDKVLSTNDYTNEEKNKLQNIEEGAQVNVQADWSQTESDRDDFIKNKPDIDKKADKATTLEGYGIADAYTIDEVDEKISNIVESIPEGFEYLKEGTGDQSVVINDIINNKALSDYSFAVGSGNISGAKAFRIKSFIDGGSRFILDDPDQLLQIDKLEVTNSEGPRISFQLKDCYDLYSRVTVNPNTNTLDIARNADGTVTVSMNDTLTVKSTYPRDEEGNVLHWMPDMKDENGNPIYVPYGEGSTYNTFRFVDYSEMGNVDIGTYAHSEGTDTQSLSMGSHSEGYQTKALSKYSHAEGNSTEAVYAAHSEGQSTKAYGQQSHAEGYNTLAKGLRSHSEGQATSAIGQMTHAEGYGSTAEGNYSHVEGQSTKSVGIGAHAEGYLTEAKGNYSHTEGYSTKTLKGYSHAEGCVTNAEGKCSHSEGNNTTASGDNSHAEGSMTIATSKNSHAEGRATEARGENSHAEGRDTVATAFNQHVQGRGNIIDDEKKYIHIVGNGKYVDSTLSERSNAHTLDWDGNAWFAGEVRVGSTEYDDGKRLATEEYVDSWITDLIFEEEKISVEESKDASCLQNLPGHSVYIDVPEDNEELIIFISGTPSHRNRTTREEWGRGFIVPKNRNILVTGGSNNIVWKSNPPFNSGKYCYLSFVTLPGTSNILGDWYEI